MTKEEKIKEAWGTLMPDYTNIDLDNGWSLNDFYEEDINDNDFHTMQIYTPCKIRPKSLQGIEDNNGWISLSGEPNEIEYVENLELYNIKTKEHYFCTDEHEFIEIGRFTHYKPIVKSKPPLY